MIRRMACLAAVFALAPAAPFTPASVLFDLRMPVPVRFYATPLPAALVAEADGRYVVHLSSTLASLGKDAFAFAYLHEAGHVALGHLIALGLEPVISRSYFPERDQALAWLREYEADRWAAVRAARAGYDPEAGLAALVARFGGSGGATHPTARERLLRLRWVLVEAGHL